MARHDSGRSWTDIALRASAALVGGYLCIWFWVGHAAHALVAAGVSRVEAAIWPTYAAFLVWLAIGLWVFSTPRAGRTWLILLGWIAVGAVLRFTHVWGA